MARLSHGRALRLGLLLYVAQAVTDAAAAFQGLAALSWLMLNLLG